MILRWASITFAVCATTHAAPTTGDTSTDGTATFDESASHAGVANDGKSFSVAMADVNNDGYLDIFLTNSGSSNKLWLNQQDGTFEDATSSAGVGNSGSSRGVVIGDINADGHLDIYVAQASGANILYLGDGTGKFTDGTADCNCGDTGMGQGVSLPDINGDGYVDIFIANFKESNVMLLNNGHGVFTDVTAQVGLSSTNSGFQGAWADADGDGDLDVVISNSGKNNAYFQNDGTGNFTDMTTASGLAGDSDMGRAIKFGDVDGDGDFDVVWVSADPGADKLYMNDGHGHFSDSTSAAGISGTSTGVAQGMQLGDVNADGRLAILVAGIGPLEENELYVNQGNGVYKDMADSANVDNVVFGQGVAFGDLTNSGTLDCYLNTWGYPPVGWPSQNNKLYMNQLQDAKYLKVRPVDSHEAAVLLFTQVRLYEAGTETAVSGVVQTDGGGGFGSQNGYDAYFGLTGQTATEFDVEIRLPGANSWISKVHIPKLGGVSVNQVLVVPVDAALAQSFRQPLTLAMQ